MSSQISVLIFTLENTQPCYASVLEFLQKLDKVQKSPQEHLTQADLRKMKESGVSEIYRFFVPNNNSDRMMQLVRDNIQRENCLTEGMLDKMETYIRQVGSSIFKFVLVVDAKSKIDRFEESFQYLFTAWQEYRGRIFFCIDNDTGDKTSTQNTYFMVSHYLLFASLSGSRTYVDNKQKRIVNEDSTSFYNSIYAWNYLPKKQLVRLAINGKSMNLSSFTKFYPLLPIDAKTQSILASSVRSVFHENWSYVQIRSMITRQPAEILHMQRASDGYRNISLEMLKAMCLNYLLESGELTKDDAKNNENKEYLYDDMSMLAFFIYSIYRYFLHKQKRDLTLSSDEKLALISDMQDFAVGVLQLIDNTVCHSLNRSGCFSVRIFSVDSEDCPGFPKEYSEYLQRSSKKKYYLEMRLIDSYSLIHDGENIHEESCIMKSVFLKNIETRLADKSFRDDGDAEKIRIFKKKFERATLADFFDPKSTGNSPDEFSMADWDAYYEVIENTLHHYGLMQFKTILKSHGGYFSVRSGFGYERSQNCYYDTEGGAGGDAYLPGTQYAIFLPISQTLRQYTTGFSIPETETDFDSLKNLSEEKCKDLPQKISSIWDLCGRQKCAEVGRHISEYLAGQLVSDQKIYSFDFRTLQQLDGKDNLNSILAREMFLKGLFHFIKARFPSQNGHSKLRLAFLYCSHAVMLEIVELFCSFYNRSAKCEAMSGIEIYLSGKDCREEFLIAGRDLLTAVALANRMNFSKGRFSPLQSVLSCKVWNRYYDSPEMSDSGEHLPHLLVPYDLILMSAEDKNECLFQSAVRKTLTTDLQSRDFGCCVSNIHIRLGSKIHITKDFYEAQELFHTSQYLSRFAYLIAKKIDSAWDWRFRQLILVGYETYSELLVLSVEKILQEVFQYDKNHPKSVKAIGHIIYENMPGTHPARLRTSIRTPLSKKDKLVLLVPINSTLSTHNKVKAALERDPRFSASVKTGILKNFGVILIRHGHNEKLTDEEKQYWKSIKCADRFIEAPNLITPPVDYIVAAQTEWENPLFCKLCYPPDYTEEKPLIGTNKASVIPTYMIGLTERNEPSAVSQGTDSEKPVALIPFSPNESENSFRDLFAPGAYRYGHFRYYENDFQFYFDIELVLERILKNKSLQGKLDGWFAAVHRTLFSEVTDPHSYNIIIAPEQPQNAGWINYVSRKLFNDSSDILHFDILKEYRDNVKTKFSNITALYSNLVLADKSAVIHFHFVDGTICSGRTLSRARSLIQSLFPEEAFNGTGNVQVKLFESVLVLLNRASIDSQRSYVDSGKFFSFIDLKVPNLRNHQDACILCRLTKEFDNLALRAASNEIAQEWARRARKLEVQPLEMIVQEDSGIRVPDPAEEKKRIRHERAYRRLVCTQKAFVWLSEMGYRRNQTSAVLDMLWELCYFNQIDVKKVRKNLNIRLPTNTIWEKLRQNWTTPPSPDTPAWVQDLARELTDPAKICDYVGDLEHYIEMLISYIKVFSRPFLTFRKSVIEASFQWRLFFLDAMLSPEQASPAARTALTPVYAYHKSDKPEKYELMMALFKALVGSLTKNGSNFIIRSKNFDRILDYYSESLKPLLPEERQEEENAKFLNWYLCNIKRLIDSNGDETKSLWLHNLLLTGREYHPNNPNIAMTPSLRPPDKVDHQLASRIYLENNRIIYDGIVDWIGNQLVFTSPEDTIPYYIENFVKFLRADYGIQEEGNPLYEGSESTVLKEVKGMVRLYKALNSKEGGSENFYGDLKLCMREASGADKVELLGVTQTEDSLKSIKSSLREKYKSQMNPGENDVGWKKIQSLTQERKGAAYYVVGKASEEFADPLRLQKALQVFLNRDDTLPGVEKIGESVLLDKQNRYIVAKIDPGSQGQGQAKIEPLYLALYRNDGNCFALLRGLRNILAFRSMFVERLKLDFNNSLMQEFALTREKADYLGQSRAAGHTQSAIINLLVNKISSSDNPESDPSVLRGYALRGLADQTCSHWYSEFVSHGNDIPVLNEASEFQTISLSSVINALDDMTFQILPGDAMDLSYKRNSKIWLRDGSGQDHPIHDCAGEGREKAHFEKWRHIKLAGSLSDVISMFVLLVINACRHGESESVPFEKQETKGPGLPSKKPTAPESMEIVLSCDSKYVTLENRILTGEGEETKTRMEQSAYQRPNRDEGISMWVINEFFKRKLIQTYFYRFDWNGTELVERIEGMLKEIQAINEKCLKFDFCQDKVPNTKECCYDVLRINIPVLYHNSDMPETGDDGLL